jgi:hypothetical protein
VGDSAKGENMNKRFSIVAGVLVLVLTSASALAQVQSKPHRDDGEKKDLPARFLLRTHRVNLEATPLAQPEIGEPGTLFKDPLPHLAGSMETASVQPQNASTSWPQWAQNSQHTGFLNVEGQHLDNIFANIVYDPLVPAEQAANAGDLLAHYQVPLTEDSAVYMEFKAGTYDPLNYSTQIWGENKFNWQGNSLVQVWSYTSDWKAPGSTNDFWEPVFHAVLANGFIYVPGKGGTIIKLNKSTGAFVNRINPFNNISSNRYTASPLSADSAGNIYYNVVALQPNTTDFYADDVQNSWLVKVTPGNAVSKVTYSALTVGAPGGNDQCLNAFVDEPLPWPPSPTAVPGSVTCGSQRAALNIAPAIAPDGTIYSVSRAHFISRWAYLVAVNSNLTPKWIASLRDRFDDGCGVPPSQGGSLPPNGAPGGCRAGANLGVDPATNGPGGGRVLDDSSSTPTVATDGSVLYGAYSRYNYAQGHMMQFSSAGQFIKAYRFGWDQTPGIDAHGSTYSVVIKDNQYGGVGSYCNDDTICPPDRTATNPAYPEAYFITRLNHNLGIEWRFQNTNTLSCTRNPDGSITCVSDHPAGFEWCVNQFAIDEESTVFANSEDGNLFAIDDNGHLKKKIFQQLALGAAYTPASLGPDGKVYSQNAGHLFAVGENQQGMMKRESIFERFEILAKAAAARRNLHR